MTLTHYRIRMFIFKKIYIRILQSVHEIPSPKNEIMDICNVFQITPEQLLTGKGIEDEREIAASSPESKFTPGDVQMIEDYHNLREEQQKRLMAYMEALKRIERLEDM